jgi:peptidoglycan lytic transglycosylase
MKTDASAMITPMRSTYRFLCIAAIVALLAACASAPPGGRPTDERDGVGAQVPPNLSQLPDAEPRIDPVRSGGPNKPYEALGRRYTPMTGDAPFRERGLASWYGRKFHGRLTASGETYDMYAMTAAHPTLPLPSYARVTSLASGRSVVVRVNDRGPFLHGRIIDLSYAAAHRIGIAQNGSGEVEVQAVLPAAIAQSPQASQPPLPPVASAAAVTTPLAPPASVQAAAGNPDAPPVASVLGGYSVQLGAFANFANAQAFLAHAQNQLATLPVEAKIRQAGGLYRVYIGPYPARSEAERFGERITQAFGFATTVGPH